MPFTTIDPNLIIPGKAVKNEIFQVIKDDLDNLQSRLAATEAGGNKVQVFDAALVNSTSALSAYGVDTYKAKSDFRITSVSIQLYTKFGITSGTLQIDVKKNTTPNPVGMESILTTLPTCNFATASDYQEFFGILDPVKQSILAGDIIQLDITSLPSIWLPKFRIVVFGEI